MGHSVPEARGQGGPDAGSMAGSPRDFLRGGGGGVGPSHGAGVGRRWVRNYTNIHVYFAALHLRAIAVNAPPSATATPNCASDDFIAIVRVVRPPLQRLRCAGF